MKYNVYITVEGRTKDDKHWTSAVRKLEIDDEDHAIGKRLLALFEEARQELNERETTDDSIKINPRVLAKMNFPK